MGGNGGYSNLNLAPHDMAKFGYLFLNRGLWNGEQIVSDSWVDEATRKHVEPSILLPNSWSARVEDVCLVLIIWGVHAPSGGGLEARKKG